MKIRGGWLQIWLVTGFVAWTIPALAIYRNWIYQLKEYELFFLLAPFVVVPLGLGVREQFSAVVDDHLRALAEMSGPWTVPLVLASFWFPEGWLSASLAASWMVPAGLLALSAMRQLLAWRSLTPADRCFAAAQLALPVGAAWLLASRLGLTPMGFQEPIVLLTAVHFHYAGFACAIFAGAVGRAFSEEYPQIRLGYWVIAAGVVAGPWLLAAGFVIHPLVKYVAALSIVVFVVLLSIATLLVVFGQGMQGGLGRFFLLVSSLAVTWPMLYAAMYAEKEYSLGYTPDLSDMIGTHGATNAFWFVLCGLIGWRLVRIESPHS